MPNTVCNYGKAIWPVFIICPHIILYSLWSYGLGEHNESCSGLYRPINWKVARCSKRLGQYKQTGRDGGLRWDRRLIGRKHGSMRWGNVSFYGRVCVCQWAGMERCGSMYFCFIFLSSGLINCVCTVVLCILVPKATPLLAKPFIMWTSGFSQGVISMIALNAPAPVMACMDMLYVFAPLIS